MEKATLLIVSGPPAAGKTTLTAKIGAALGWPVFAKDVFKEKLFDTLGYSDRAWSRKLGLASVFVLYQVIEAELRAGRSVIAECNFYYEYDAPQMARLEQEYGCAMREVRCTADPEVIIARFMARWERGERHPGHVDWVQEVELRARLAADMHHALLPDAQVLTIDTTDPSVLDDATLLAAVRALVEVD